VPEEREESAIDGNRDAERREGEEGRVGKWGGMAKRKIEKSGRGKGIEESVEERRS
jgi:hypothetical protein